MNYLDLFSGIGGFAYGAWLAGMKFKDHYFSEIDPYCVQLYKKRFPDAIPLGDITKINTSELPNGDWIITGGFPCQDISTAGKGAGIEGKRSGLWFEMWRIIRDLRPKFVIAENVGALTFRGIDRVLSSLAEIGYDAEWKDIRASDVGLPHKRERIFIIAYTVLIGLENIMQKYESIAKLYKKQTTNAFGEYSTIERIYRSRDSEFIRRGPRVSGIMDRLRGLGNSIIPQIAAMLFEQIKPHLNQEANDEKTTTRKTV